MKSIKMTEFSFIIMRFLFLIAIGFTLIAIGLNFEKQARIKAGIPEYAIAHEVNGQYYWRFRGLFPVGDPNNIISSDRYYTYYNTSLKGTVIVILGCPFGLLGIFSIIPYFYKKMYGKELFE